MVKTKTKKNYIPAFRFDWLTPLFDPFIRVTVQESTFKKRIVQEASLNENSSVLDLGCGTGTLAVLLKQAYPWAQVTGLDADERILQIARSKVEKAGLTVSLDKGTASNLIYADNTFDLTVSSLMFHHLTWEDKSLALKEVYRILRPTGIFLLADFGYPANTLMHLSTLVMRNLEESADCYKGLLPEMMQVAGFLQVQIIASYSTLFGTLCLYKGFKPGS